MQRPSVVCRRLGSSQTRVYKSLLESGDLWISEIVVGYKPKALQSSWEQVLPCGLRSDHGSTWIHKHVLYQRILVSSVPSAPLLESKGHQSNYQTPKAILGEFPILSSEDGCSYAELDRAGPRPLEPAQLQSACTLPHGTHTAFPKPVPRRDREAGVRKTSHLECVGFPVQIFRALKESNILKPFHRVMCRGEKCLAVLYGDTAF